MKTPNEPSRRWKLPISIRSQNSVLGWAD